MKYSLRPALASDIEWLDPFYERVMRPYVELTHEWNFEVFRETFKPSNSQIIQVDGKDVGLCKHEVMDGHLFLWDLQLEEEYRQKGIGSELLVMLQEKAKGSGIPMKLRVLKGNPAIEFYRRHGFVVIEEMENCFQMEWRVV